ncbi:pimeloyl-ACP methyl ester carboxylesterase [Catenuloplanes nepalensis]|uniref:Pimeloyl-ACP methyl ester carboxylesterase n=1 Tax=Catenuloplanes nepalensis TaxID=587533 RepID=A0ABT9MLT0_9ACTN|nr:alpha/beta hydrolase [Catenuloplanes nepalensis]MDP9792383.1 pimeloyl-ACP methyl ester carboxylesterase [Catenuloplanes nepalensis]
MNNTPVVLVHGFWHGSWAWSAVAERLARTGVPSLAVDLDGSGLRGGSPEARWARPFDPAVFAVAPSPVADVTATGAAEMLNAQLRALGRPAVVVAHSMGGIVATRAAELAPELFAELVYVAAHAPVAGLPSVAYVSMPESAGAQVPGLLCADPTATGALRIDPADPARHAAIRECFYHDVEAATADAAIALLGTDGSFGIPAETFEVTPERYGRVPHAYVVCTEDRVVPAALQRRFIREIDAISARPATVVEMKTSHSPFLSAPEAVAETIAAAHRRSAGVPVSSGGRV